MPTIKQVALLLLAVLAVANAHPQPVKSEENCTCEPGAKAFQSYHIHVLFYPEPSLDFKSKTNPHNSQFARSLRKKFVEDFNVSDCPSGREHPAYDLPDLCAFAVDATGAGDIINAAPFVVPNFAIYVPVDHYAEVVPWMMANRGDLDFLLHPNTCGFKCSKNDHLLWSMWGGNKWPVRFQLDEEEVAEQVV